MNTNTEHKHEHEHENRTEHEPNTPMEPNTGQTEPNTFPNKSPLNPPPPLYPRGRAPLKNWKNNWNYEIRKSYV